VPIAWLALLLLPAAAAAQQTEARAETVAQETLGPGRRPAFPEFQRRLDAFRRRRLEQALGIDSLRAGEIEAELRRFRDRQLDLRRERAQLLDELQRSLDAEATDEAALERRLDALRKNQEARERALSDLRGSLARDLTLEQQAKLQLFAERFQSRLAQGLQDIQERRRFHPVAPPDPVGPPGRGDSTDGRQGPR
jgi:hypothetical protein